MIVQHVTSACMRCHKQSILKLDENDIARWNKGAFVQDVWPKFSPEQRELLITGTHPECWAAMFDGMEEE